MISKTQLWPYLNEIIPSKLQHQLGCKVLILKHNMYQGYLGKIIGTVQNNKVKIIVHKSSSTTINSIEKHNEKKKSYIPLKLFCKMLNVEISTILIILDSLIVNLSQKSDLFDKFGATIDIGLNIINKDFLRIVPELVICKKIEEGFCPNKRDFELIELSEETVDLVKEYQKNFPSIFAFINAHPRLYYNATDFQEKNSKFDANVEIVKIYVWIMKQINSSLVQVPLNSKV